MNQKKGKPNRQRKKTRVNKRRGHGQNFRVRIRGSMPDSVLVHLVYQDDQEIRQNVPGTTGSWRYRMNSVYDPDPLLGTGALSGFTEWAAMFGKYRVEEFRYNIRIANLELFPQMVIVAPSITDLGANFSRITQMPEVPGGKSSLVSGMGGQDKCFFKGKINLTNFLGSRTLLLSDNYASNTNTNPNNQLYFNVGFSTGGATSTKGLFCSTRLFYTVVLYGRVNLTL